MKVTRNIAKLEAVRGGQRQHDVVLGRRRLKLEVELAAEALAQRQTPGAIDAAAERRMNDELHPARFVEEALKHDRRPGSAGSRKRLRRGKIFDELLGGRQGDADVLSQPAPGRCSGRVGAEARRDVGAQTRHGGDSSSVRPGASPSQKGMVGGCPWASSTRTVPRSTR